MHFRGAMEKIDENRSASRGKSSPETRNHRQESLTKASGSKGHINDISQLTIASNRLEDSIKAPNRPP